MDKNHGKLGTIEPRWNDYIKGLTEWDAKELLAFVNGVLLKYNDDKADKAIVRYIRSILNTEATVVHDYIRENDWMHPTTELKDYDTN